MTLGHVVQQCAINGRVNRTRYALGTRDLTRQKITRVNISRRRLTVILDGYNHRVSTRHNLTFKQTNKDRRGCVKWQLVKRRRRRVNTRASGLFYLTKNQTKSGRQQHASVDLVTTRQPRCKDVSGDDGVQVTTGANIRRVLSGNGRSTRGSASHGAYHRVRLSIK